MTTRKANSYIRTSNEERRKREKKKATAPLRCEIIFALNGKSEMSGGAMLTRLQPLPTSICLSPSLRRNLRDKGMQGKSLNATAASLLGLLHDGPANGSRLCALAHQRLGPFWSTTRSQVYRELPLLQERGYVEAGEPGKRHSLPYSVTPSGRRAFGKWMTSVSLVDSIRIPVLLVASFSHLARPEQIEKLLLAEIGRRFGVEQEIRSAIAVASDEGRACVAQALTLAATLQGELLDCLTQLTSMLPSQPGDQS